MFEEFDILIQGIIAGQVELNIKILTGFLMKLYHAGCGVYLMVLFYRISTGALAIKDCINTIFVLAFINAILMADGLLTGRIVPIVTNLGDTIALKLLGRDGISSSALGLVDSILENSLKYMHAMWEAILKKGIKDIIGELIPAAIGTFFMLVGALAMTAYGGMYLILVKVVVAVLLSVAPIFIMLATFPATRNYFQQWVGQCLNNIMIAILFALMFSIVNEAVLGITSKVVGNQSSDITPFTFVILCAMYILGYALLNSAVSLAAQLTGSMANLHGAQSSALGMSKMAGAMSVGGLAGGAVRGGALLGSGASKAKKIYDSFRKNTMGGRA